MIDLWVYVAEVVVVVVLAATWTCLQQNAQKARANRANWHCNWELQLAPPNSIVWQPNSSKRDTSSLELPPPLARSRGPQERPLHDLDDGHLFVGAGQTSIAPLKLVCL